MSSTHSRNLYPVLAMLLGASMWGVTWYPMRLLEDGGLHGLWLSLLLYTAALAVGLPWSWRSIGEFSRSPGLVAAMILGGGWTNVAFILSVLDGNVLRVLLLFYLSPLWATLLGWLFLRETISRTALASLAFAMIGALIMLWNPEHGAPWPEGTSDWLALSAGFAFAVANAAARKEQHISIAAKVMCIWLGVIAIAGVMIVATATPMPRVSLSIFSGAVLLGVTGILVMTVLVQYAVTHIPVHHSAVLALIELVAGAVSQQLLTDEIVSIREWIGGALIVAGAYFTARAAANAH
jgi:drug/metabolite transporter (DMT)-like permease